jgi:uridine kinase
LRDLRSRGRTRASVLEQLKKNVEPMHERFVAPQKKWADIVLRHTFGAAEVQQLVRELHARINLPRSTRVENEA